MSAALDFKAMLEAALRGPSVSCEKFDNLFAINDILSSAWVSLHFIKSFPLLHAFAFCLRSDAVLSVSSWVADAEDEGSVSIYGSSLGFFGDTNTSAKDPRSLDLFQRCAHPLDHCAVEVSPSHKRWCRERPGTMSA